MKRWLTPILSSVLLLIGWTSIPVNAQAQSTAEAHVAAAKAIAASVPKTAKNELDFDYIIAAQCTEPMSTTPVQDAEALRRPPNTSARPRADW